MKKYPVLIFILFLCNSLNAQQLNQSQLDSVYNLFTRNLGIKTGNHAVIQSAGRQRVKCGFGLSYTVRANFNRFTPAQKIILKTLVDRPVTDTSMVTPGGFFRIHYDTAGPTAPVYSLDSLAIALDSAYNFEVNYLGYPPPPSDNDAGGDNKYDIYISPTFVGYGTTTPDNEVVPGSNRFTSFMLIQNDYSSFGDTSNFNTDYRGKKGINAARVTVSHEFHHSIQMGNYILRYDQDAFFYELTSTSMEHFVYPNIKDYLFYLPSYFYNTQTSLGSNVSPVEYAMAIWNIYLKDTFGYDIIKKQWELMPEMRALQAIANAFADYNTTFGEQLNKFGVWTYYTNYRTIPNKYFEDAAYYPTVQPVANLLISSSSPVQLVSKPVSNNFITILNPQNRDSVVSIITNADVDNGVNNTDADLPFSFSLYNYPRDGSTRLTDNYFEYFSADRPAFWVTSAVINNRLIDTSFFVLQNINYVFPSPFNYSKSKYIYIPAQPDANGYTELDVYNISMKLVYSTNQLVNYIYGQKVIRWNALDNHNSKLSSGVYIYVTKSGNDIKKGKLVIFNE